MSETMEIEICVECDECNTELDINVTGDRWNTIRVMPCPICGAASELKGFDRAVEAVNEQFTGGPND